LIRQHLLRWLKTNYGSAKGFKRYLQNEFFDNATPNDKFFGTDNSSSSTDYYILSDEYKKLFGLRTDIANALNSALFNKLSDEFGFEELSARNPYANGYGVFSANLSKAEIYRLAEDERFLFTSINDKSNYIDGIDKLYNNLEFNSNGSIKVKAKNKYTGVVLKDDLISGGFNSSRDEALSIIAKYTRVDIEDVDYIWYNSTESGKAKITDFGDAKKGAYRFHSFTDDVHLANKNGYSEHSVR
jgi:hypothetical protein